MKIVAAAMIYNGVIVSLPRPKRHHDIINTLGNTQPWPISGEQGFLTDEGEFVDRRKAAEIALAAGQCSELDTPPNLFSEDLW